MFIKNFEVLAKTPLRRQALRIAESALDALDAKRAVRAVLNLNTKTNHLKTADRSYDLNNISRIVLIGLGKVALEGARAVYEILGEKIACGFVLDVREGSVGSNIICKVGTHPAPTLINVAATDALLSMLDGLAENDLVICIVSGGGSSLLCAPFSRSCEFQSGIETELTRAGAGILELNTVRKHLSLVKGGQLALRCRPARVLSLIFSDVPCGDMSAVASGPTVLDVSTAHDAKLILDKYKIAERLKLGSISLRETPKDATLFSHVQNVLVVSARLALEGAAKKARDLGWRVNIAPASFVGEAREIGKKFAANLKTGECLLAAGESTVYLGDVEHLGVGGRNQELALGSLEVLDEQSVLVALASDGFDNTPFAGAIVDTLTLRAAGELNIKFQDTLCSHNSYDFFRMTGDGLETGRTGMNVADLLIALKE